MERVALLSEAPVGAGDILGRPRARPGEGRSGSLWRTRCGITSWRCSVRPTGTSPARQPCWGSRAIRSARGSRSTGSVRPRPTRRPGAALGGPHQTASPLSTSRALEVMVEKVQSFGGRVEEMGASGLVAAFGHEPVEDAPRRAAPAALAIHNAAERARRVEEAPGPGKGG